MTMTHKNYGYFLIDFSLTQESLLNRQGDISNHYAKPDVVHTAARGRYQKDIPSHVWKHIIRLWLETYLLALSSIPWPLFLK